MVIVKPKAINPYETKVKRTVGRPHKKSNAGRPTVVTSFVIAKLEHAFSIDATVGEACSFAGISYDAYYDYIKKNPKFAERVVALREKPVLLARDTIVKGLGDIQNAQWYIERKRKNEFSTKQEVDSNVNLKIGKLEEIQDSTQKLLNQ